MTSPTPVRIAVVGAGLIGKRHAKHVSEESQTSLVAIVEPTPAGTQLAAGYGIPCFESLQDLIASDVSFDAAILGTPTHTHVPLALTCVAANKHCLIEKPISSDLQSGRELLEACKSSQAKVLVGHHRRFNPYILQLKKALSNGSIGQPLGISGVWTTLKPQDYFDVEWRRSASGGGTIAINLIHDIDLLRYLFGDVTRVYAEEGKRTRGFEVEETGAVTLRFANAAVGTFLFSDATPSPFSFEGATGENPDLIGKYKQNVYTIFGTRGSIQFPELKRYSYDHLSDTKDHGWLQRVQTTSEFAEVDDSVPPFTTQLVHFAKVCRGEEPPNCTAEEGLKSLEVLSAIKESLIKKVPMDL